MLAICTYNVPNIILI